MTNNRNKDAYLRLEYKIQNNPPVLSLDESLFWIDKLFPTRIRYGELHYTIVYQVPDNDPNASLLISIRESEKKDNKLGYLAFNYIHIEVYPPKDPCRFYAKFLLIKARKLLCDRGNGRKRILDFTKEGLLLYGLN